jgi:hypothetical protein
LKPVFKMAKWKEGCGYAICALPTLHESAHECRILCRENDDPANRRLSPYILPHPVRDDQPEILVPESLDDVSGDSQHSDEVVASSLPVQAPPPANPPSPLRLREEGADLPPHSPLLPLSYDESTSDDEPIEDPIEDFGESDQEDGLTLTNTVTGIVRRFRHDNNGRLYPI